MFFKQFPTREATLSYFYGCGGLGKAVAVDVVLGDEDWFVSEAEKAGVRIAYVIETHVHADHVSGGRRLAERTGAEFCLHERAGDSVRSPFRSLKDGEILETGNVLTKVLHTPGHTPDSICLLVSDLRRGMDPWFVLTGDTLFVGSVGRPDLGGEPAELAGQIFESLHGKILSLPDEVEVYPGHTSGSVCGAGISGKPSSTVGFEKRFNPFLAIKDPEAFISALTADIPAKPQEFERIVAANCA
ncbi:MAG: MBL fold metallo-hydrolase [Leptospirillum sp.]